MSINQLNIFLCEILATAGLFVHTNTLKLNIHSNTSKSEIKKKIGSKTENIGTFIANKMKLLSTFYFKITTMKLAIGYTI